MRHYRYCLSLLLCLLVFAAGSFRSSSFASDPITETKLSDTGLNENLGLLNPGALSEELTNSAACSVSQPMLSSNSPTPSTDSSVFEWPLLEFLDKITQPLGDLNTLKSLADLGDRIRNLQDDRSPNIVKKKLKSLARRLKKLGYEQVEEDQGLREPISNASDAYSGLGIGRGDVIVRFDEKEGSAEIEDFGRGMNLADYLFKLLIPGQSSKRVDLNNPNIGEFGEGFYSLLGFLRKPGDKIVVYSRKMDANADDPSYQITLYLAEGNQAEIDLDPIKFLRIGFQTSQRKKPGSRIFLKTKGLAESRAGEPMVNYLEREIVTKNFRFLTQSRILVNGKKEINPILPQGTPVLPVAKGTRFAGTIKIPGKKLDKGEGVIFLLNKGVLFQEVPIKGEGIYSEVVIELPESTDKTSARNQVDFRSPDAQSFGLAIAQAIDETEDVSLISSLAPLLGNSGYRILHKTQFKPRSFVLPNLAELTGLETIDGQKVQMIDKTVYDLMAEAKLPSKQKMGPFPVVVSQFKDKPWVRIVEIKQKPVLFVDPRIHLDSPLRLNLIQALYHLKREFEPHLPNLDSYFVEDEKEETKEGFEKKHPSSSESSSDEMLGISVINTVFTNFWRHIKDNQWNSMENGAIYRERWEQFGNRALAQHQSAIQAIYSLALEISRERRESLPSVFEQVWLSVIKICKGFELDDGNQFNLVFGGVAVDEDLLDMEIPFPTRLMGMKEEELSQWLSKIREITFLIEPDHSTINQDEVSDLARLSQAHGFPKISSLYKKVRKLAKGAPAVTLLKNCLDNRFLAGSSEEVLDYYIHMWTTIEATVPQLLGDFQNLDNLAKFHYPKLINSEDISTYFYFDSKMTFGSEWLAIAKKYSANSRSRFHNQFVEANLFFTTFCSEFTSVPKLQDFISRNCQHYIANLFDQLIAGKIDLEVFSHLKSLSAMQAESHQFSYDDFETSPNQPTTVEELHRSLIESGVLNPASAPYLYPLFYGDTILPRLSNVLFPAGYYFLGDDAKPLEKDSYVQAILAGQDIPAEIRKAVNQHLAPNFWIRELIRNSKEAEARTIDVNAYKGTQGELIVEFQNNGKGITEETKDNFYLPGSEESILSILKYYDEVLVESWMADKPGYKYVINLKKDGSGLRIEKNLILVTTPEAHFTKGTRTTCLRKEPIGTTTLAELKGNLISFTANLGRSDSTQPRVLVRFNGEPLDKFESSHAASNVAHVPLIVNEREAGFIHVYFGTETGVFHNGYLQKENLDPSMLDLSEVVAESLRDVPGHFSVDVEGELKVAGTEFVERKQIEPQIKNALIQGASKVLETVLLQNPRKLKIPKDFFHSFVEKEPSSMSLDEQKGGVSPLKQVVKPEEMEAFVLNHPLGTKFLSLLTIREKVAHSMQARGFLGKNGHYVVASQWNPQALIQDLISKLGIEYHSIIIQFVSEIDLKFRNLRMQLNSVQSIGAVSDINSREIMDFSPEDIADPNETGESVVGKLTDKELVQEKATMLKMRNFVEGELKYFYPHLDFRVKFYNSIDFGNAHAFQAQRGSKKTFAFNLKGKSYATFKKMLSDKTLTKAGYTSILETATHELVHAEEPLRAITHNQRFNNDHWLRIEDLFKFDQSSLNELKESFSTGTGARNSEHQDAPVRVTP